jgi:hypothetical protein
MTGDSDGLHEQTELPVRPKVVVSENNFDQPREVVWGHLSQVRGAVRDDRVEIVRQPRKHTFGRGTTDHGHARRLYKGSVSDALDVYRALDALFTGGEMEVDPDAE